MQDRTVISLRSGVDSACGEGVPSRTTNRGSTDSGASLRDQPAAREKFPARERTVTPAGFRLIAIFWNIISDRVRGTVCRFIRESKFLADLTQTSSRFGSFCINTLDAVSFATRSITGIPYLLRAGNSRD
jgi:hypothetical protein